MCETAWQTDHVLTWGWRWSEATPAALLLTIAGADAWGVLIGIVLLGALADWIVLRRLPPERQTLALAAGRATVRAVGRQRAGGRRLRSAGRLGPGAWRDLFDEPPAIRDRVSEPAAVALLLLARHAADHA